MFNKYKIYSPSEIITTRLGIPLEYKQKCIQKIYDLGDSMNQTTNVKASMSTYSIFNESNIFDPLLERIRKTIYKFYPQPNEYKWDLISAWGIIYKKGHYTISHSHKPNDLSFSYYLQCDSSTPLIFENDGFNITPKEDMIIIFPSYINHNVPKHLSNKDRIVMSGNFKLKM